MSVIFQSIKISLVACLWLAILVSGLTVAFVTHQARSLQNDLQTLLKEKDNLRDQWTQLLLEQSVWATDARVDAMARHDLVMMTPATSVVVVLP